MDVSKKDEATRLAKDIAKKYPYNFKSHLSLWHLDHKTVHLENAIKYKPDSVPLYILTALSHIIEDEKIPDNYFINIKYLSEEDRKNIVLEIIFSMYRDNFGLEFDIEDIEFILNIYPNAESIFYLLPEYNTLYKNIFECIYKKRNLSRKKIIISEKIKENVADILLRAGRILLAIDYGYKYEDDNTFVKAIASIGDLEFLASTSNERLDGKLNEAGYILCGLSIIESKNWELFDKFEEVYSKKYINQTNLLMAYYNFAKKTYNGSKFYFLIYFSNLTNNSYLEDSYINWLEEKFLCFDGMKMIGSKFEDPDKNIDSSSIRKDFNILLPHIFIRYTYWPLQYIMNCNLSGKNVDARNELPFLIEGYNQKVKLKINNKEFNNFISLNNLKNYYIIRLPNTIGIVNCSDFVGGYSRKRLLNIRELNKEIDLLFEKEVYGKKLSQKEIEASFQLHQAWLYYWNSGKVQEAIEFIDKAINIDEKFYDAYLLRSKLLFINGNYEKSIKDYKIAEKIAPVQKKKIKYLEKRDLCTRLRSGVEKEHLQ